MQPVLPLFLVLITSFSEEPVSGIFIIHNPPKKITCENELRMLVGKTKVCLSKKPILDIQELEYVTDIQYDPKLETYFIDIGISSVGIHVLNKTVDSLPKSKFAIVIQDDIICLFFVQTDYVIRTIRIGEDTELKTLQLIHDALQKIKN